MLPTTVFRSSLRASLLACLLVACDDKPKTHCDAASLTRALARARAGDTVRVGACTIEGNFVVPGGVTLSGVGAKSVLRSATATVVRMSADSSLPTTVRDLHVEGAARIGIFGTGDGELVVRGVTLAPTAGAGVVFDRARRVTIEQVTVTGALPQASASLSAEDARKASQSQLWIRVAAVSGDAPSETCPSVPVEQRCEVGATRTDDDALCPACGTVNQYCDSCFTWRTVTATQGIVLSQVTDAELTDVEVRGVADTAVYLVGDGTPTLSWTGGTIGETLGVGLFADGVQASFTDVSIETIYQGFRPRSAVGAWFSARKGSTFVETTDVVVRECEGYGAIHDGSGGNALDAQHMRLQAIGNGNAAVWAGDTRTFRLTDGNLRDNRLAGVVLVRSYDVTIEGTDVVDTVLGKMPDPDNGAVFSSKELGDGIQLFGTTERVTLSDVGLIGNERIGLSVDLGEGEVSSSTVLCTAGVGLCFDNVRISRKRMTALPGEPELGRLGAQAGDGRAVAEGTAYSVNPIDPDGAWATNLVRDSDAAEADEQFDDPFDLSGASAPQVPPSPDAVPTEI